MHAPAYRIPLQDRGLTVTNVIKYLKEKGFLVASYDRWTKRTEKGNLVAHTYRELAQDLTQLPIDVPPQKALDIDAMLLLRDRMCEICEELESS